MRASDIMTRPVITVRPETLVRQAATMLADNGFTALPVVDDNGELVGIVTEADLVRDHILVDPRYRPAGQEPPEQAAAATVGEVMTTPAVEMPGRTDVTELARCMLHDHVRSIPITDGRQLVGIVTGRDLVRCLTRTDPAIAADVRHRLEIYGGPGRWRVYVQHGQVEITDELANVADAHVAKIIAAAVIGVESVTVSGAQSVQPTGPYTKDQRPAHISRRALPIESSSVQS